MRNIFVTILILTLIVSCGSEEHKKEESKESDTPKKEQRTYNPISKNAVVSIGVENIELSLKFWEQIGFKLIEEGEEPHPWKLLTDGSVYLSLNQDDAKYMGWLFFQPNWQQKLKTIPNTISHQEFETQGHYQHLYISPDSNVLSIVEVPHRESINTSELVNYLDFIEDKNFDLEDVTLPNKKLGVFGELSYPVKNIEDAIVFWESFGFQNDGLMEQPYPFAIMYDGLNIVGLHETYKFKDPGITYFANDQKEHIEQLKNEGFKVVEFMPGMEDKNVVIKSPSGYNVFIFSTQL